MGSEVKTYEQAYRRPSRKIWPGCNDGRCMPCGNIHDFSYSVHEGMMHNFCCSHNYRLGCPLPKPEPVHTWDKKRCSKCGKSAGWIAPNGMRYGTLHAAKMDGVGKIFLIREQNEELLELLKNDSLGG